LAYHRRRGEGKRRLILLQKRPEWETAVEKKRGRKEEQGFRSPKKEEGGKIGLFFSFFGRNRKKRVTTRPSHPQMKKKKKKRGKGGYPFPIERRREKRSQFIFLEREGTPKNFWF